MNALMVRVYQALLPLPCAVTRLWPQTLVPIPSVAFGVAVAAPGERGTRCQLLLEARALTPEAAGTLAASARDRLVPLGFELAGWHDEEVRDSGCFAVALRMAGEFLPDGAPVPLPGITFNGTPVGGLRTLTPPTKERLFTDTTQPNDPVRTYAPQPLQPGRITFTAHLLPDDPGQILLRDALTAGSKMSITITDPPQAPVSAQGYAASITAHGPMLTAVIQLTG